MNVGDRIQLPFAKGTKEGVVFRLRGNHVWLKVDFPRHPGKLVRRKLAQLQTSGTKKRSRKSK